MLFVVMMMVVMAGVADGADKGWTGWAGWSTCTSTCGGGLKMRQRSCKNPKAELDPCVGDSRDIQVCGDMACPPAGGWSSWFRWTPCTVTCGGGMTYRQRWCDNPPPGTGGAYCVGDSQEISRCNDDSCDNGADFVAFSVKLTHSFAPSHMTQIPFDGLVYNGGGFYHFKENEFVAPTKGVYLFTFSGVGKVKHSCNGEPDLTLFIGNPKKPVARAMSEASSNALYNQAGASVIVAMQKGDNASLWQWGGGLFAEPREYYNISNLFSGYLLQAMI